MLSSIDINNIAMTHNPNGSTQNQDQSLSVPLAQYSVNRAYSLADLDTPKDTIDDISSTLAHTSEQDIDNVDNNSETRGSQSIDINSLSLNNHVANDSEFSLSIHTPVLHSNNGTIQNQGQLSLGNSSNVNESQSIDINVINLNNNVANDCESMSGSPTQQSNRTDDSVLTDEKEDSIASRMKRRRNQQSEDNDDKNNSYEY